ncbi:hypothetical protein KUM39_26280 [Streptomyces sp. J2-1]|uniref:hypothetical protein n=1 Tax=Streptomyces corallincola TaxID=2851888 RepID=UPI001C3829DC|nr:hypothetical protein [Streptomyces corallincola]MBV2357822.1 hypothetical protein [Streptomyces corallincola]
MSNTVPSPGVDVAAQILREALADTGAGPGTMYAHVRNLSARVGQLEGAIRAALIVLQSQAGTEATR